MPSVLASAVTIETFRASGEGCLGYLVVDEATRTALAIDPRLDLVPRFQEALVNRDLHLRYVLDTHTHADHLSGVRVLARRTGATVVAHAASRLKGEAGRVQGGDSLDLGEQTVVVLDAPGHTPDSLALLVDGHLFTGDALFVGGAGRTDFMGGSAGALFETFRRFETLPESTVVHPGHDYVGRAVTTIAAEKTENPLFREGDREVLVARLSAKAAPPADMAAILRHNLDDADAPTIGARELAACREVQPELTILDVRTPLEFESERIEGAVNLFLGELEARLEEVPESADVVVVCRTGIRATIAAERLVRAGRRARVLEGGIQGWRRAGLPLREGRKRLPVDRQVQLIAGTSILTGVALGTLVNPWFLALAAFFGAGLTFAGATGTCGLALLLLRLPWNRLSATADIGGAVCAAGGAATCAAPGPPRS